MSNWPWGGGFGGGKEAHLYPPWTQTGDFPQTRAKANVCNFQMSPFYMKYGIMGGHRNTTADTNLTMPISCTSWQDHPQFHGVRMMPVMGPISPMNMVGMIMIRYHSSIEFEKVVCNNNMVEMRTSLIPDPEIFGDIQASVSVVGKYDQRFTAGYDHSFEAPQTLDVDLRDFEITDE